MDIGIMSTIMKLDTSNVSIADNLQTLIDCKADMKSAIESKEVTVSGGLSTYADAIRSIKFKGYDFTVLGYSDAESTECNDDIYNSITYSKDILDNWNPNTTNAYRYFFTNYPNVRYVPLIDTSNITGTAYIYDDTGNVHTQLDGMTEMFVNCYNLIYVPPIDTHNVKLMDFAFSGCRALKNISYFNTSNVVSAHGMFKNCGSLTTIPKYDFSSLVDMNEMFTECENLINIPEINTESVRWMGSSFLNCTSLIGLPLLDCGKMVDFQPFSYYNSGYSYAISDIKGFENLGKVSFLNTNSSNTINFSALDKLTRESCINIFNNLYNRKTNGYSIIKIRFNSKVISLLSNDDIAIATAKGWTITT